MRRTSACSSWPPCSSSSRRARPSFILSPAASSRDGAQGLKYVGAAYLVYRGVRRILDRRPVLTSERTAAPRLRRAFVDGVISNVLNPKTALFFLAFLPQFVDVSRGAVGAQILCLGVLFVALGLITDGAYALTAGTAARWLRGRPRFLASERWISGGMYIGLGVAAAVSTGNRK
jgi:threonine/homoserine/homoserine lactone efflux protein